MLVESGYTSRELFHFCGYHTLGKNDETYSIMLKILKAGCISHPPHNNDWGTTGYTIHQTGSLLDETYLHPKVTCYCDIPREHLSIHVTKYGPFGLSFLKDFAIRYGVRPVLYVPLRSDDWQSPYGKTMIKNIEAKFRAFTKHVVSRIDSNEYTSTGVGSEPTNAEEASKHLAHIIERDFIAFLKPFNSHLPDDHKDNYYLEREWRKFGNLKFEVNDVNRVLLAADYVERFKDEMPLYAGKVEAI